jgi:type II secretory pathway predicted ATPase ExeA/cell division septation protein DedD
MWYWTLPRTYTADGNTNSNMYEAFYHLNTNPFRITPDPKFCFSHAGYKSAREYLYYALRLGEGFIMVTGRPGTGKTTLAETFLKDLDPTKVSAKRVAVSGLEADDLLRAVAFAYGIEASGLDKATLRHRIQQYFILQEQQGRRALLIIDEAQGLPPSSLEELRLLADLQAESRPLLQLFLVGQEALRDLMCTPGMNQFQQRIIATCHLKPLGIRETRAYINHRLCQAGWKGDPELTGTALLAIHRYSWGVPRHINKLCNRLLVFGYGKGKHILTDIEVRSISEELREELLTPLGHSLETSDAFSAIQPGEDPRDDAYSLSELVLDRNSVQVENADPPLAPAPMVRSETHAATRQSRKNAQRRVQAKAKARRERQPVKSSSLQESSVSRQDEVRRDYASWVARLFTRRDRLKAGIAWGAAALVVTTLSTAGLARFPGEERTDMAIMPDEHRTPINTYSPAHSEEWRNRDIAIPHTGQHEPPPQMLASIPNSTPELPPGNRNRFDGSRNAAVVEATSRVPTPEKIPIAATPVVEPPPVEAVTLPAQVSKTTQDGSEINGLEADRDNLAMAAPNRVLPDIESMDAPAAGDVTGQMVLAEDHSVAPPVSREEKIAALPAQVQQAMRKFRLLTPADDNAKAEVHGNEIQTDTVSGLEMLSPPATTKAKASTLADVNTNNSDTATGSDLQTKSMQPTVDVKIQLQESNRVSGRWAINLVSLQRKVDAEHFLKKANSKGVEAEIIQVTVREKKYWRVQVPGFSSPDEARTESIEVKNKLGLKDVWIVQR